MEEEQHSESFRHPLLRIPVLALGACTLPLERVLVDLQFPAQYRILSCIPLGMYGETRRRGTYAPAE